jgi:hypothetical protein
MHIVKFLFRTVEQINPSAFDDTEGQILHQKMLDKYKSINVNLEDETVKKDSLPVKAVLFFNNPFVQFFLAAFQPFFVKGLKDYLNGRYDEPIENENQVS